MNQSFHFTHDNLRRQYVAAQHAGYAFTTCEKYCENKAEAAVAPRTIVNRVDIDFSVKKLEPLIDLFNDLNIQGSFFLRLHAPEYNPFSFENYRILRKLLDTGHELGYHSEVIDQSVIWGEDAEACLKRDLDVMEKMFGVRVRGVASHGGLTGLNNLDFWRNRKPADFGLLYEAYDHEPTFNLFQEAFYISDSEWMRWKCYDKGKLRAGDHRTFEQHLADTHELIYLLVHPDTYFRHSIYENER